MFGRRVEGLRRPRWVEGRRIRREWRGSLSRLDLRSGIGGLGPRQREIAVVAAGNTAEIVVVVDENHSIEEIRR